MTGFSRNDIVLVNFVFSEESGVKKRPAVVVSSDAYNGDRSELIIAAITSRTDRLLYADYVMSDWRGAGLLRPSVVTAILRTIKQDMVAVKLGAMKKNDAAQLDSSLRKVFAWTARLS